MKNGIKKQHMENRFLKLTKCNMISPLLSSFQISKDSKANKKNLKKNNEVEWHSGERL